MAGPLGIAISLSRPFLFQISWGTKQDNEVETDLGAVIQNSQSQVDVEILAEPSDVNEMYDETLYNLKTRKPVMKPNTIPSAVEKEQQAKDYYASVRTNVLLAWVLSNVSQLSVFLFLCFSYHFPFPHRACCSWLS